MSKLNRPTSINLSIKSHPDRTVNFEDGLAFNQSPELRLYRMACTSMFGENKFYQSASDHDSELSQAISEVEDTAYLLQLAKYVRNDMYLRTVPVVLLAEATALAKNYFKTTGEHPNIPVRAYAPQILKRVDDCTECLAYYLGKYGKPIPNALKRGIADALSQFDEYQLGKYRAEGKDVKLSDVIRLCGRHLIKEGNPFHKAVEGTLRSEGTWGVEISDKGNTKEAWESVLPRMGIMAVLRNLRNMLIANVDVKLIETRFTDEAILNSKQLPFRWYSAWKAITEPNDVIFQMSDGISGIIDLLEHAMTISCQNVPKLSGETAIFIDHSGSMDTPLSERSTVEYFEVGAVLGVIAQFCCDSSIVGLFGEIFQLVNLRKQSGILNNADILKHTDVGHTTNAWKCVAALISESHKVDRIIILTDMQVYNNTGSDYPYHTSHRYRIGGVHKPEPYQSLYGELVKYRRTINNNVKTYILDLAGYSTTCTPEDDNGVIQIAGWSDKIFQFVNAIEADPQTVIKQIKKE